MTVLVWKEVALAKEHDRAAFDCGDTDLNTYLQRYARRPHPSLPRKRGRVGWGDGAKCFLAVAVNAPSRVLGFYTLSPASIEYARTPPLVKKKPRSP